MVAFPQDIEKIQCEVGWEKMMKRRVVVRVWSVWVLLVLLTGCGGGGGNEPQLEDAPRLNPSVELPATLGAWPSLGDRHPGVPEEYDLVAGSDHLQLYLKRETSALIVEDKRNRRLWRSSPTDLGEVTVSQAWRSRIESPILLGFTDADRGRAKVAKPDDMEVDFTPVEGGVRATYRFPGQGFELGVFYVVRDDVLEVTIPENSIVESEEGGNFLISLDVLSFLGAAHDGEEGYIVFPDGSGAIMGYKSPHLEAVQEISVSAYGDDQIRLEEEEVFRRRAPMPVVGLISGDNAGRKAAFVAIIAQGDFDASLAVGRSGKTIPYNHSWVQFVYRRQGEFSLTGGQPAWLYQPDMAGGDRQIRYCFLTEEDASYAGMAIRYRDFLIHERGAQRISGDAPLMSLDFFMAVERRNWFLRDLVQMTTFAHVQEILADLDAAGVSRVDVTVDGWNEGGAESRYPQRLPVEARLGGEDGLRALAKDVRARGQRLFLTDNYIVVLPEGRGAFPYSDAMRGVDGLPIRQGGFFLLNPQVSLRKFALRDIPKMSDLGADGLRLNYFATLTVPDTNDRYPLSRENFAASWMQIADLAREQFGVVAMTGGNTYAIPYADRLDWVPMDSTHYDLFDERIPFYQIVAHGLVLYNDEPFNLHNDGGRTFLHQVEYGAIPHFVLTREDSALLTRTFAAEHWSTQYDFWRDEIIRQYQAMERLAPLVDQFIVAHACLAEGVYQTTYEDGTRVVVNYNERPYTLESVTVPATDFVVLQGPP
jgi:hypothetical protein